MNYNRNVAVVRVTLTENQYYKLTDVIYYGARDAAQKIYTFHRPVYDEDAGVYTDYGQNEQSVTWANLHFLSLLGNAIVCVHKLKTPGEPVIIDLLDMAIPAISQLLIAVWSDTELQTQIWKRRAGDDWESDGHYGSQSKQEFTADMNEHWWIDRKTGREIIDRFDDRRYAKRMQFTLHEKPTTKYQKIEFMTA